MVKIAVFCNDAAVSNNILPILKKYAAKYTWYVYVHKDSPAWKIFQSNRIDLIELEENADIKEELTKGDPDVVYVGTSWQNTTHLEFIKVAKTLQIRSIAAMDHWVNYRERFGYPHETWQDNLPDFITVNDEDGYKTAKKFHFPNIIKLRFYALLEDITLFQNKKIKEHDSVLFISEPTQKVALTTFGDENYWGFNEFDVCEEICKNMDIFATDNLTIRLHPSDEPKKYDYLPSRYPNVHIQIESPYEKALIDSLCENKIIIGIDGFVLYEAMVLGKVSLSLIPSSKRECFVPLFEQNKIQSISQDLKLDHFKNRNCTHQTESFGIDFATMIDERIKTPTKRII
ncbi:MAG: hypothetical protein PHX13_03890 [Thiovulaceae bacterium]|nr:hypothetical protein [Sulfurimonadaceae bacterium]